MGSNHLSLCPFSLSCVAAKPNSHIRAARSHLTSPLTDVAPMSALHHCVRPHLVWPTGGSLVSDTSSPRSPRSHGSYAHVSHDQPDTRGRLLWPVGNLVIRVNPLTSAYKYQAPSCPSTKHRRRAGRRRSRVKGRDSAATVDSRVRQRRVSRARAGSFATSSWGCPSPLREGRITKSPVIPHQNHSATTGPPHAVGSSVAVFTPVRDTLFCLPCHSFHVAPAGFGFGALGAPLHDTPARPQCAGGRRRYLDIVSGRRITGNVDHWAYNFD